MGLARASLPCMSKILPIAHAFAVAGLHILPSIFDYFLVPLPLWLALPKDWALLDGGLCFSLAYPFSCYHLLPYHSITSAVKLFALILLGLFGPAVYSSPNGLVWPLVLLLHQWRAPVSHLFSLERPKPVCFPWASSVLFLTLHSHGLSLNSLGFLGLITLSLVLGVHGFAINPLLSLLSLLWACRGLNSLFHIIYYPWFSFSLFSDSFKSIYLLKAHLFISCACDPLFLPLELNGFSIYLPTLFRSCFWASPFHLGFQNGHQ